MDFDGITGLEAEITFNGLTLNRRRALAGSGFRYKVTDIGGLDDADVRDAREPNPGRDGEMAMPAYYGGRTITITGKIMAANVRSLRQMQQDLRTAFGALVEAPMIFNNGASATVYITVRKSAPVQMREVQGDQFPTREFMVTVRASDPRFYSSVTQSAGATNITTNKTFVATNTGNASTEPVIRVNGPLLALATNQTEWSIRNTTTGEYFYLPVSAVTAASTFTVDINTRARTITGGYTYASFRSGSQFPNVRPGGNTFQIVGLTGVGRVTCIYKAAWM